MTEYLLDRRDVDFVLFEHLGITDLTKSQRFGDLQPEFFQIVLDEAQKMAQDVLAPLQDIGDKEGCTLENGQVTLPDGFKEAYKKFRNGGWVSPHLSPEWGGQGLPGTLYLAVTEFFIGACTSFIFYPGLTTSAAHLIEVFGSEDLHKRFLRKMFSGKWAGTMCLTEPHAGSAVGDLKTSAEPQEDGTFKIKGTKIFITGGDHDLADNIIHLVLARAKGDPDGIKGISLFAVPKKWVNEKGKAGELNDVSVGAIEHKMGINAASTCVMNFGDNDECRGLLVGEQRQGIVAMFQMMNEARIICGTQGMALGNAAYQHALGYAKERVQGTHVKDFKNAAAERVAIVEHADVKRMLALMKSYGEALRALILSTSYKFDQFQAETDEGKKGALWDRINLLTPICKAYATDLGFKMTELAMQTYGGYGYVREYPVEQYMRDVKIASIYEGTNGIQAMDLLGRKMRMKGGSVFMSWMQDLNEFVAKNIEHSELGGAFKELERAKNALAEVTFAFAAAGNGDPDYPMLHACNVLEMMGNIICGQLLLEHALIAEEKLATVDAQSSDGIFYANKIRTARFFAHNVVPRTVSIAKIIGTQDRSALEMVW